MNTYKIVKQKETATAIISLGNDGIVRVLFKDMVKVTPVEVEENFKVYNEIVGGVSYPFIISGKSGSADYTTEGLAYAKAHENDWPKLCVALCIKGLAQRLLANFYLRFNKPRHTHKVFDNISDAEVWCTEQLAKSKGKDFESMPIFI